MFRLRRRESVGNGQTHWLLLASSLPPDDNRYLSLPDCDFFRTAATSEDFELPSNERLAKRICLSPVSAAVDWAQRSGYWPDASTDLPTLKIDVDAFLEGLSESGTAGNPSVPPQWSTGSVQEFDGDGIAMPMPAGAFGPFAHSELPASRSAAGNPSVPPQWSTGSVQEFDGDGIAMPMPAGAFGPVLDSDLQAFRSRREQGVTAVASWLLQNVCESSAAELIGDHVKQQTNAAEDFPFLQSCSKEVESRQDQYGASNITSELPSEPDLSSNERNSEPLLTAAGTEVGAAFIEESKVKDVANRRRQRTSTKTLRELLRKGPVAARSGDDAGWEWRQGYSPPFTFKIMRKKCAGGCRKRIGETLKWLVDGSGLREGDRQSVKEILYEALGFFHALDLARRKCLPCSFFSIMEASLPGGLASIPASRIVRLFHACFVYVQALSVSRYHTLPIWMSHFWRLCTLQEGDSYKQAFFEFFTAHIETRTIQLLKRDARTRTYVRAPKAPIKRWLKALASQDPKVAEDMRNCVAVILNNARKCGGLSRLLQRPFATFLQPLLERESPMSDTALQSPDALSSDTATSDTSRGSPSCSSTQELRTDKPSTSQGVRVCETEEKEANRDSGNTDILQSLPGEYSTFATKCRPDSGPTLGKLHPGIEWIWPCSGDCKKWFEDVLPPRKQSVYPSQSAISLFFETLKAVSRSDCQLCAMLKLGRNARSALRADGDFMMMALKDFFKSCDKYISTIEPESVDNLASWFPWYWELVSQTGLLGLDLGPYFVIIWRALVDAQTILRSTNVAAVKNIAGVVEQLTLPSYPRVNLVVLPTLCKRLIMVAEDYLMTPQYEELKKLLEFLAKRCMRDIHWA